MNNLFVELQVHDAKFIEEWRQTLWYCPYCGHSTVWKLARRSSSYNLKDIPTIPILMCVTCLGIWNFDIEGSRVIHPWERDRIEQLRKQIGKT